MYVQNIISRNAAEISVEQVFQQQFMELCLPSIEKYVKRIKGKTKRARKIVSSIVMDVSLNYEKYRLNELLARDKGVLITKLLQIANAHIYVELRRKRKAKNSVPTKCC